MRTLAVRTRTLVRLGLAAWACGCLGGCEDDPTSSEFRVALVDPLSIEYVGGVHKINARANIRVDWRIEFLNLSRGCTVATRTVCDFWDDDINQERVSFTWTPRTPPEFFAGDSILARAITEPALDPGAADRGVVRFVYGQSSEPPSAHMP